MGSLHSMNGSLLLSFYYRGVRCREYLQLRDTRDNRRRAQVLLKDLEGALGRPDFDFAKWFPESKRLAKFVEPVKAAPTVSSYYARWLETLEISKASRYDYQCLGHAYVDRTRLGPMEVAKVSAMDIREVVKASTSLRRTTMLLQCLRAMFDAAIDDGLIDRNPAARVKNPKRRTPAETIEPFTKAEVAKIVAAAQGMDRALVVTMLGTGAGPGELLAVRRTDIDLKSKQLQIRGSYGRFGEGATKTPGRVRVIDQVDVVVPVIATLRSIWQLRAFMNQSLPTSVAAFSTS